MNRSTILSILVRASNPLVLLGGLFAYVLGGGVADYLGTTIRWPVFWIGLGAVVFLHLSSFFLKEYFDRSEQPAFASGPLKDEDGPPRVSFLQIGVTTLTAGAVLTVLLVSLGVASLGFYLILGVSFIISIAYAVPPLRLVNTGYGELTLAILQANLIPAMAFLLQTGEFHRLLALLTFPLTFLYLAVFLAMSLRPYLDDLRKERQTMMVRLGWQRGMNLHNILIASAYLVLATAFFLGLPWRLAFPIFLSLPLALFEVWQINQIADGKKPRWRLLSLTALATLGLAYYFMNLALWTG